MKYISLIFIILVLLITQNSCKKDQFIDNNYPPNYSNVSTAKIKNYINRLYIDLLGREALSTEMTRDVEALKSDSLSLDSRMNLIHFLQTDTVYHEGDSSYQKAYYNRLYETLKARLIEGVEDDYIYEQLGVIQASLPPARAAGDSFQVAQITEDIAECYAVLNIKNDLLLKNIDIAGAHRVLLDNFVYETINMNTFNFVNSTFDNLFYRFPTAEEFSIGYNMIENNQSGYILGKNGNSRGDYLDIVTQSLSFREGVIRWAYKSMVQRDPTASEVSTFLNLYGDKIDYEDLQKKIMATDEYAHFN